MKLDDAASHANACIALLNDGRLEDALTYCAAQRVDPPQCSLTAKSPNADKLRALAMEHLSNESWWRKRLAIGAKRDAEMAKLNQHRHG